MPKIKTKSGAQKRFKVTAGGKVLYQQSRKRHGMIKRTKKQIRQLRGTAVLFKTDGDNIKKYWLPNGEFGRALFKEIRHGPREAWRYGTRQTQESPQGRQRLLRTAQEYDPHR